MRMPKRNGLGKHFLCWLGDGQGAVLLRATGGQRRESRHEEVQASEEGMCTTRQRTEATSANLEQDEMEKQ